ncbi:UDP-N-acetylmuramoyl-tripeptide--D-alanyl-D-alanine ligase [Nakamurella antarctica]|uniref:UDP-N-acetylmuramoyl-tripeptide--D-alanyl-D-alanine ligase n=1 Tax=Nakamurella antarctica TaxID=1902245 RepID=A0A3G8ZLF3_9ACTN|nr:UDP-N-acetylmuramoyl-tripeptide--D-alanyl-D-alanine ligase [Nakamurella antarctica]AZI57665.1 UDP-N-acetylmuramoyl-tripeptide--D-alanyl-D-alanine ligase [Nakamurella antarctica]
MKSMTVSEVAEAIGTPILGSAKDATDDSGVTSVEFDTRKVSPGALFVALVGERVDGHDFVDAAVAAGAVAVLGSKDLDIDVPLLRVADNDAVLQALAELAARSAAALTAQGQLTTIGITGSAGKTSTKDLIAALASAAGSTIAPPESFNNELGHPYTVLRATEQTRFLVLELSARGPGHVAMLAKVAPPRIGVVLNVGSAHIGEFGSVDGIAQAKSELVQALPAAADGGVAILNADDSRVAAMATRTRARVVTFGTHPGADVRAENVTEDHHARAGFTLMTPRGAVPVQLAVSGVHQVSNALAAAAVGLEIGVSLQDIAQVLGASGPASKWRMEITDRADGVTVINDAYNANPEAMKAALKALVTIGTGRRRWAVLGEMAELGEISRAAHDEIGRLVVRLGIERLIAVGAGVRGLHLGAQLEGSWDGESEHVPDWEDAVRILGDELRPGDVVLVKASRAVGLERVAHALLHGNPPASGDADENGISE